MVQEVHLLEPFLISLRHRLRVWTRLSSSIRAVRALIHFGPWRALPRFMIRQLRPAERTMPDAKTSLLGSLDTHTIVEQLRQHSIAIAGVLPEKFVSRLRTVTDHLPVDHYQLMHHIDNDVYQLSKDPAIMNVLRAYFRCEPVLLESTLLVTGSHGHKRGGQNVFHFDYAGWESLNVFVYLSDVSLQSSPHTVARGSHRNRGFSDAIRGSLPDDEALRRFGSSLQVVTGPAGLLFFENTEAFHRREPGDERRVMLNLLYASHRGRLSYGRTSPAHIEQRTKRLAALREHLPRTAGTSHHG